MPRFERICPECGTGNAFRNSRCAKCHAPLTGATQVSPPAASLSRRGMAKLAWRATKFLTRASINLARTSAKRSLEQIQNRNTQDVKNETIDADYKLREWRVWGAKPEPPSPDKNGDMRWGKKP